MLNLSLPPGQQTWMDFLCSFIVLKVWELKSYKNYIPSYLTTPRSCNLIPLWSDGFLMLSDTKVSLLYSSVYVYNTATNKNSKWNPGTLVAMFWQNLSSLTSALKFFCRYPHFSFEPVILTLLCLKNNTKIVEINLM